MREAHMEKKMFEIIVETSEEKMVVFVDGLMETISPAKYEGKTEYPCIIYSLKS